MTTPQGNGATRQSVKQAMVALITVGILVSFCIWYTARSQRIADARWCDLVTSLDDRWRALPNPPPEARKLSSDLGAMRKTLDCAEPRPVQTDPSTPSPLRS